MAKYRVEYIVEMLVIRIVEAGDKQEAWEAALVQEGPPESEERGEAQCDIIDLVDGDETE